MTDVLIRDVPGDDLELIRSAAADRGLSVQSYLRGALHAHAVHLRRQEALERLALQLRDRPAVPEPERAAVLESMAAEHDRRAERLDDHSSP